MKSKMLGAFIFLMLIHFVYAVSSDQEHGRTGIPIDVMSALIRQAKGRVEIVDLPNGLQRYCFRSNSFDVYDAMTCLGYPTNRVMTPSGKMLDQYVKDSGRYSPFMPIEEQK